MKTLGIDLSMTSPALCLHDGKKFEFSKCKFFFLTSHKKFLYKDSNVHGEMFPEWDCDSERYNNIATWVVDLAKLHGVDKITIEGYSFASVGRVFNIAENGGVLKYLLWKNELPYTSIPPTTIKKFATGKGNANKEALQTRFIEDTQFNLKKILGMTEKQWNPSSDIIDSYYVCKYGVENE